MQLFSQLFDTHTVAMTEHASSTFVTPMAELSASPVCLADVLSTDGSIVTAVLENYAIKHAPDQTDRFSELSMLVADDKMDFLPTRDRSKRQLDFVYPVV
ncbi:MAG: hypothetical protein ACI82I_001399 [Gammaproteobacteria bacterium]|jgi:hypothetical protein